MNEVKVTINSAGFAEMFMSAGIAEAVHKAAAEVASVAEALQPGRPLAAHDIKVVDTTAHELGVHFKGRYDTNRPASAVVATGSAWKGDANKDGDPVAGAPSSFLDALDHLGGGA